MSNRTAPVSVDLQESPTTRAVVEAISRDNDEVSVRHMPGLVKLSRAGEMVINRETVEEILGRPWNTHEFQLSIVSYSGNIGWDDDQIIIRWERRARKVTR